MNEQNKQEVAPDSTAVRVALWRALHVEKDAPPHVFEDILGLHLASPDANWRERPDMNLEATKLFRASIVARSRFIEDLAVEEAERGITQYIILGAGLDTFAERRKEIAARLRVFEVDKPSAQLWKQQRLRELGYDIPEYLKFVPVDFEKGQNWWKDLIARGFKENLPTIVSCAGVTLYLTRDAVQATLHQLASLAKGSTLALTYLLPPDLAEAAERSPREMAEKGARASGTPFLTFFAPEEILELARTAGFQEAKCVPAKELMQRYFAGRTDGLRLSKSEEILIAKT